MIPDKVNNLFQFIEFLHSNIENFNNLEGVLNELNFLEKEKSKLKPQDNYKDKIKCDELNIQIKDKGKVVDERIIEPIMNKVNELSIWKWGDILTVRSWNIADIKRLISNFSHDDKEEIDLYASKYSEFKNQVNIQGLLSSTLGELDKILKELFGYFVDKFESEFEEDETNVMPIESQYAGSSENQNDLNYYSNIAHRLYIGNTKIGATKFEPFDFIEAIHSEAPFKGKVFYQNLIQAMPNHFGAQMKEDLYIQVLQYCKQKIDSTDEPEQADTGIEQDQQPDNNFTLSTIEDWLFEFKENMSEVDYKTLVSALMQYFDTGTFPTLTKPILINGRPNKKLFGWALNRIFFAKSKGVELQLLQFAKQNISLFANVKFDESDISRSNLYKYFTTKTK
ncbi:MAG: hypothetical protein JNJ58_12890 [Chitinophagaceae bacterium]|nr:hypothetical protein [Chitinophagaceae bacterium]